MGNTTVIVVSRLDSKFHTPMYFFLTNLSFLDLAFTTSIMPSCSTECVLLTIMAFDRYVAVYRPLNYTTVMHPSFCKALAGRAWLSGVGNTVIQSTITCGFLDVGTIVSTTSCVKCLP
ncbi:hypothetical protein GHT09_014722 [Marmota monax]|uniref:G-protein coupled receptors family 1 profile domain-containing protein n=1 Tax=Marmota monax TaxID=9995 RepID=A0A834QB59_MARMO|nr:hypothetical protein GHT09_014722 [Marmota monax]